MKKTIVLLTAFAFAAVLSAKADVYADNCAKCHGEDGKGQTKMGAKMGCRDYTTVAIDADKAFKDVKEGLKDKDGKTLMKPFGETLSDADIKAAIEHMKSFKK
jgi:mono/diheme cytochrome c family protein